MEALLARVCAPALAGIKPANLVAVDKHKYPRLHEELERLGDRLGTRGIRFDVLCECETKALVLVYRPSVLQKALQDHEIRAILSMFGYEADASADKQLDRLRCRMACEEFPHEIGAFLGYPAADIRGFLSDRREGVKLVGEWKVYDDAEGAKRLFSRYAACRSALSRRLAAGNTLADIFCAA